VKSGSDSASVNAVTTNHSLVSGVAVNPRRMWASRSINASVAPKMALAPTVPYKGSVVATHRVPLRANHYVSLAEAITKFQKNTPDRFRTMPKGRIPVKRKN
jgi:hypothetical protein